MPTVVYSNKALLARSFASLNASRAQLKVIRLERGMSMKPRRVGARMPLSPHLLSQRSTTFIPQAPLVSHADERRGSAPLSHRRGYRPYPAASVRDFLSAALKSPAKHRRAWTRSLAESLRLPKRARAEAAIGRFEQVIGDGLRSCMDERRATEVDVAVHALNRMLELGRPISVRTA
jgi:hypothetical protein